MKMARLRILKTGTEIMWHMHYLWDGLTKEVYFIISRFCSWYGAAYLSLQWSAVE